MIHSIQDTSVRSHCPSFQICLPLKTLPCILHILTFMRETLSITPFQCTSQAILLPLDMGPT